MKTASGRPAGLSINDASATGEARRMASALAGQLGFGETARGQVAIVATEAATNLFKHAEGGEILLQGWESGSIVGLDILAVDKGPGMADLDRCRVDGFSTAGSPGHGLGAMGRLSGFFEIHSIPGVGTSAMARFFSGSPAVSGLEFGVVSLPMAGEEVSGDSWAIDEFEGRTIVMVVDGLGHGPQAYEAARAAVEIFEEKARQGPAELIQAAHRALRSTRGAALAVAQIDPDRGEVVYAGVGNIAGSIHGPSDLRSLSMVSHNGIVGHTIRKVQEFTYPWISGSLLLMHSDGLATQWQLGRYPGLTSQHPGLIAATLHRDFKRVRDDVTVLAIGESRSTNPR
jgi:anti-sigma regulatory factor (Ser/Thr protein kinase)